MYQQFSKETRIELAGFRRTGDCITDTRFARGQPSGRNAHA